MAQMMTGKQAVLEMLKAEGVKHIFGNPGTSEGPIMDMLGDYPEFQYFLTLQESVAVGMGESYARSTETASCVMLHVDSGLANGICLMLDALNTGTPMVVMSANYDARKVNETMTDLAELVRPVTKWSVELDLADAIPSVLRRAFHEANSHPKGPVYVGFSANALEAEAEMNIVPSSKMHDSYRPDTNGIEKAVSLIMSAKNPMMMVGDRVSEDHANDAAVELAELMGFPVYQSRGAEVAFPTMHPQFFGNHTLRTPGGREILKGKEEFDVLLENKDKLYIPPLQKVVSVIGEVQFSSSHQYSGNLTVEDYLNKAGGPKRQADMERMYVIRANGSVMLPNNSYWFSRKNEELKPGDTIVVPIDTDYLDSLSAWTSATQILYQIGVAWNAIQN